MTTYNCKDCGKSVELSKGGEFVRPCGCSAPHHRQPQGDGPWRFLSGW